MDLTLLIPMYNEQAILPDTLQRLSAYAGENFSDYEILFVDDGSTDASAATVAAFPDPHVRLLSYAPNRGKGCAVRTGMLDARGEVILFTDCDLAYGTEAIGEMVAFLQARPAADAVIASRALHPDGYAGYSLARKVFSKAYRAVLRLFYGLTLSDSQSGLKAFRRAAAQKIFSRAEVDRFAFDFEAIMIGQKLGLSFAEMPARVIANRPNGKVNLLRDTVRMLRDLRKVKRRVRKMETRDEGRGT